MERASQQEPLSPESPAAASSRPRRPKLALLLALVTLGASGCALLVGECVLQVVYRKTKGEWLPFVSKPFRVTCVAPIADGREYTLRAGFHDDEVNVDMFGFRAPQGRGIPRGLDCVVTAGDSVAFGANLRDADTYPAALDDLLTSRGVRVLNAGVPSYNFRQSLLRMQHDVLPFYKPRVVVLQAACDLSLFALYGTQWTPDVTFATAAFADQLPAGMSERFASAHYLKQALTNWRAKLASRESLDGARARMLRSITDDVRALRADPRMRGVPLVLMPINPFYFQSDDARSRRLSNWKSLEATTLGWMELVRQINGALEKVIDPAHDLHWFDARLVMDATGREGMYRDWGHFTPAGSRAFAAGLSEYLLKSGWLAGKRAPGET